MVWTNWQFTWALIAGHHGVCLSLNAFFFLVFRVDLFREHKLQPDRWPEPALVRKAVRNFLVDALLVLPLAAYFIIVPILQMTAAEEMPGVVVGAAQLAVMLLMTDALFYASHRVLHHRSLYSWVHKQHHEFKTTVVIAFEYSHPIETALNTLTVVVPPLVVGAHPVMTAVSIGLRMWESVDCHCGYELPWYVSPWVLLRTPRRHDYHHARNLGSFGIFPIWDKLLGTAEPYEEWRRKTLKQTR